MPVLQSITLCIRKRGIHRGRKGSPCGRFIREIAPAESDRQIVKYYADSFHSTELEMSLKEQGIGNIVICGVQTEFCVDTTCRSAFAHGYKVELASDCHSTFDSDLLLAEQIIAHHNAILAQFAQIKPVAGIEFER